VGCALSEIDCATRGARQQVSPEVATALKITVPGLPDRTGWPDLNLRSDRLAGGTTTTRYIQLPVTHPPIPCDRPLRSPLEIERQTHPKLPWGSIELIVAALGDDVRGVGEVGCVKRQALEQCRLLMVHV
jgi:hypothetical protein